MFSLSAQSVWKIWMPLFLNVMWAVCMCTCVCVYGKKGVYFKELAHAIMEAVKFKICRVGLQTKDPSKN